MNINTRKVALIGEYSPDVKAHRAIPIALEMASEQIGCEVVAEWAPTNEIEGNAEKRLSGYDALWYGYEPITISEAYSHA